MREIDPASALRIGNPGFADVPLTRNRPVENLSPGRYLVLRDWEIGAGLRYWWLRAQDGEHQQAGLDLQLLELESQRFGLTLSVAHRW